MIYTMLILTCLIIVFYILFEELKKIQKTLNIVRLDIFRIEDQVNNANRELNSYFDKVKELQKNIVNKNYQSID